MTIDDRRFAGGTSLLKTARRPGGSAIVDRTRTILLEAVAAIGIWRRSRCT